MCSSDLSLLATMRGGDLRQRMTLNRRDEFQAVEAGFNQMAGELTSLVGQAQRSAIQVTTSVNEIAATARQQQATATETAATTTQIGATSREIAATSRDLVRTMNEVSHAAEQTAGLAGTGQVGLSRMESTMHHVMDAAGSVNARLATLNEKAGNINQVVTTIARVADQTNLLSLNAAIEAEKAGEAGRGFSVVATEIRRLADQTSVSTWDIEQMLKEMQSAVSASKQAAVIAASVGITPTALPQEGEATPEAVDHLKKFLSLPVGKERSDYFAAHKAAIIKAARKGEKPAAVARAIAYAYTYDFTAKLIREDRDANPEAYPAPAAGES